MTPNLARKLLHSMKRIRCVEEMIAASKDLTAASPGGLPSAPVNAQCPVSGKSVDISKTVLHEGKLIAFCCDDCKAKFQQDPKPLLAKLNLNSSVTETTPRKK